MVDHRLCIALSFLLPPSNSLGARVRGEVEGRIEMITARMNYYLNTSSSYFKF